MSLQKILLPIILLVAGGFAYYFFPQKSETKQQLDLKTLVKRSEFVIKVTATGELQAKRSEKIMGPQGMRTAGIWETTISDLVTEGTIVKAGDYVASLDKTEITDKIRAAQTEVEKIQTQLEQAKIDTAIELRGLRDQLVNLQFDKKDKLLQLEQSKYEAPSIIQQAQINLERTERDYKQLITKTELTREKSVAKISEINATLRQEQAKLNKLTNLAKEFIVNAPKSGMIIYSRTWDGKVGPGSRLRAWDPVVAELPDLSDMVSKTYVNEVDISRVKKGQDVVIMVDAFPDNQYTGKVLKVANIGEQLRGYDAKVFEIVVQVNESDSILRPAMTTSNEIVTDIIPNVLHIPLEALHSDSLNFVYKNEAGKIVKQEVIVGLTNEDEIIVEHGLEAGDEIYLSTPFGREEFKFIPLDAEIKNEIAQKLAAEAEARKARMQEKMNSVKDELISDDNDSGGNVIIF